MPSSFASEALVIWGHTKVLSLHTSSNPYLSKACAASLAHDLLQLCVACTSRAYVLQLQDLSRIVGKEGRSPLDSSKDCRKLAYVQLIDKIGPDLQKLNFLLVCLLLLQACRQPFWCHQPICEQGLQVTNWIKQ